MTNIPETQSPDDDPYRTFMRLFVTSDYDLTETTSHGPKFISGRQIGYLRLRGLTNTDSAGRQYQFWIVGSDVSGNEIINGGIFPVDQSTGELIFPILADQFVQQPMMFVVDVEPSANGTALPTSLVAKTDSER